MYLGPEGYELTCNLGRPAVPGSKQGTKGGTEEEEKKKIGRGDRKKEESEYYKYLGTMGEVLVSPV